MGLLVNWLPIANFKFNPTELNKKFCMLAQRNLGESEEKTKDYNVIVDSIMSLTGSYSSKTKCEAIPIPSPVVKNIPHQVLIPKVSNRPLSNYELPQFPIKQPSEQFIYRNQSPFSDFWHDIPNMPSHSDSQLIPSETDLARLPSFITKNYTNRSFTGELFANQLLAKRQSLNNNEFEFEFFRGKKAKVEGSVCSAISRTESMNLIVNDQKGTCEPNNDSLIPPLILSREPSNISDYPEIPTFSRFNSSISYAFDKTT